MSVTWVADVSAWLEAWAGVVRLALGVGAAAGVVAAVWTISRG